MTTPMRYLAFWFKKNQKELGYDSQYIAVLSHLSFTIDDLILRRIGNIENKRDTYLDYFCSFADFNSLCLDLEITSNDFFVNSLRNIYNQKFPMEKKKLQKMWNLKPKGIS